MDIPESFPYMDSAPLRRRLRYSLRSLWLLVTALCGFLGASWHFVIAPAERQRAIVEMVEGLGGKVGRGSRYDEDPWFIVALRQCLPRDYIDGVGWISLDDLPATDQHIAQFRCLNQLGTMYLRGTHLTDAAATDLRELRQLEILDLSGTKLTDTGFIELCDLPLLSSLFLDDTQVTDEGLGHLPTQSMLQVLSLRNTPVTDVSLARLSRFENLKSLDITGTRVTAAGVQSFQQAKRKCLVVGSPPNS